jgi:hypothetical protein
MTPQLRLLNRVSPLLGLLTIAACSDPLKFDNTPVVVEGEEICEASQDWLPNTPELPQFLPVPHPAGECPFYRSGWQNFLLAMQPDTNGVPAMVNSPDFLTIDQVFQHTAQHPANRSYLGDIKQAGARQILVDQNGNTLYYGIAVNKAFSDFIHKYQLENPDNLRAYPDNYPNLTFPAGVVEFKSAWQVVEGTPDQIAAQTENFISMQTSVPTLSQDADGTIHEDRDNPRMVTVRLLAIHVVSTLVGHPEFIWASFEHSTAYPVDGEDRMAIEGFRDVAPIGLVDGTAGTDFNPDPIDLNRSITAAADPNKGYILYKQGTPMNVSNKPFNAESEMHLMGQKFMDGNVAQQTSIYRMFPASKSNTIDPDAAITSLNHNVGVLFKNAKAAGLIKPNDKRGNYRLVGAQWMDKPRFFEHDASLQNDETSPMIKGPHISQEGEMVPAVDRDVLITDIKENGSDSQYSILAGEDRMSSTAMESFTQPPGAFNNCFTCHNTQAITASGIPKNKDPDTAAVPLLKPGLLNVSHVLSQFLLEEREDAEAMAAAAAK